MNTFQSGVNRLLNTTAVATGAVVKYTTDKYTAERGAQYNKAYEAQVEAAQKSYTKSGAKSKSNAAKEAQAAAEAAAAGAHPARHLPGRTAEECGGHPFGPLHVRHRPHRQPHRAVGADRSPRQGAGHPAGAHHALLRGSAPLLPHAAGHGLAAGAAVDGRAAGRCAV